MMISAPAPKFRSGEAVRTSGWKFPSELPPEIGDLLYDDVFQLRLSVSKLGILKKYYIFLYNEQW